MLFVFCFCSIFVVVGAFIIYTSRALKGLQFTESFWIVAVMIAICLFFIFVAIGLTICIFRYTGILNDEDATKELVRDVRVVYQDVSNDWFSETTKYVKWIFAWKCLTCIQLHSGFSIFQGVRGLRYEHSDRNIPAEPPIVTDSYLGSHCLSNALSKSS